MQERGQAQPFDAQRPGPVPGRRDASGGRGAGRGGRDAQPPSARQRGRRRRRRRRRLLLLAVFITVHTPETRHQLHGGGRRRRPFDVADKAAAADAAAASDGGPSAPRSRVRVGNNNDNVNDSITETTFRRARVRRANLLDVAEGEVRSFPAIFDFCVFTTFTARRTDQQPFSCSILKIHCDYNTVTSYYVSLDVHCILLLLNQTKSFAC